MKNIEIELYRRGTTVYGWCNYLREELKGTGLLAGSVSDFRLCSLTTTYLQEDFLDLCESVVKNVGFMTTFETEEKAMEVCEKIRKCVNLLNAEQVEEKNEIERVM